MDGRITSEPTPEGRIAAVVFSVWVQMRDHEKKDPDYADYRDALRPFLRRELILALMQDLRHQTGAIMTFRAAELGKELVEANLEIARISDRFHLA